MLKKNYYLQQMTNEKFYQNLLNSLKNPIVFADCNHVIQYMNKAAIEQYKEGKALIRQSIFDCHNEESNAIIRDVYEKMLHEGLDEKMITNNSKHRIYMRAVRDENHQLMGYYERYEPPVGA